MVQRVFDQIASVDADLDITIATSASQSEALSMQVGGKFELAVEPERRDTAPAIMLSCAHLGLVQGAQDDDPVIVMPIDTFADQAFYNCISTIAQAVSSDVADLVLLGAKPTYPSEKYGYILPSSAMGSALPVEEFREKPSLAMAESYIARGGLWNCGVFGFKLGLLQRITREYVDVSTYDEMLDRYSELPKNSFDYEVVERAQSVCVIPHEGTWKDLGTWDALCEELSEHISGPATVDDADAKDVHVINELDVPVVVAGISNAVVVVSSEGVLVASKSASSDIKGLVETASKTRPGATSEHGGRVQ
jgi:mannose-1-phosphate guanylyltransferase